MVHDIDYRGKVVIIVGSEGEGNKGSCYLIIAILFQQFNEG